MKFDNTCLIKLEQSTVKNKQQKNNNKINK